MPNDDVNAQPVAQEAERHKSAKTKARWKRGSSIGGGGQANVLETTDTTGELPGEYVMKEPKSKDAERWRRFRAEVENARKIDHPNVVPIVDAFVPSEADEKPFLIMPRMAKGELWAFVEGHRTDVLALLDCHVGICMGVEAAHAQGIVHRDLKPSNILFDANWKPRVADFGISFALGQGDGRSTKVDERVGPRDFMAPELEEFGVVAVTPTSDVYSLGKLLWFIFGSKSENVVFPRERWSEARHNLVELRSGDMRMRYVNERVLAHSVVEDPGKRFQTVAEMRGAVEEVRDLIARGFEPLGSAMRCKFCGLGTYILAVDPDPSRDTAELHALLGIGGIASLGVSASARQCRAVVCDECGHVQIFRMDLAKSRLGMKWQI